MELGRRVDALVDSVGKPSRYIGGEMNAAAKPWEAAAVRFAFCFPDVYEVGMSTRGRTRCASACLRHGWTWRT